MRNSTVLSLALLGAVGAAILGNASASPAAVLAPRPAIDEPAAGSREVAVLAGGCFWGVEGVYRHVNGVLGVTSGYSGGAARITK
jgi:peptide-methionine (S)-S-oxide reductase